MMSHSQTQQFRGCCRHHEPSRPIAGRATKIAPVSTPSPQLAALQARANGSPKVRQLRAAELLVNSRSQPAIAHAADTTSQRGAVAQFNGFTFSGQKKKQYERIVARLKQDPNVANLVENVLGAGGITIRTDDKNDTRYDRSRRTIYVSKSKSPRAAAAAILFELNNANNPHTYTDAAESGLLAMGQLGESPQGADFIHVAREMEKDEFVSLVNYAYQVENLAPLGLSTTDLKEKYQGVLDDGQLSYEKFDAQNRSSGHTIELAKSSHQAFTGGYSEFPEVSYAYENPSGYAAYMTGKGSTRVRSQIKKKLDDKESRGVNTVSDRIRKTAPAFDPSDVGATYHLLPSASASPSATPAPSAGSSSPQPVAPLRAMPASPGRAEQQRIARLENTFGVRVRLTDAEIEEDLRAIQAAPGAGGYRPEPVVPSRVTPVNPRRAEQQRIARLENTFGVRIQLTDEEIEEDLKAIRDGS